MADEVKKIKITSNRGGRIVVGEKPKPEKKEETKETKKVKEG